MSWARAAAIRFRNLFRRGRLESELQDEIRFHLEMQVEDNVRAGMSPADARAAALRSFGGVEAAKEIYRDRRSFAWIETTAQDFRYAARTLRRSPAFTLTAVTVLALAIGANTAIFSVLEATLLRPLPFRSPDRLALLWTEDPTRGLREGRTAYSNIEQWQRDSRSFTELAFFDPASAALGGAEEAEHIRVARISPNLFRVLGIEPLAGRIFSDREAEQRERVCFISRRLWEARFARSTEAIGAPIELDGRPFRVIGVMPDTLVADADVWTPHTTAPDWEALRRARGVGSWFVVGRLRPAVTFEQAQAEMTAIARRGEEPSGVNVTPLGLQVVGPRSRLTLWTVAGAVLLVLLVAASNVASLSLARGASRGREIAVRAALGASRGRIVRQLLAESMTLAAAAGALGLALAAAGNRVILALKPGNLARLNEVRIDPQALGWASGLCLLTGMILGLAPALSLSRGISTARQNGRGIAGGAAVRLRRWLVMAEFAIAIVLLSGAGLLLRSLWSVERVPLGFRPERALSVQLETPASMPAGQRAGFYESVVGEVEALPGVERAGIVGDLFIGGNPELEITVEGDARDSSRRLRFRRDEASPGFFQAVGTPLLRGRFFSREEGPDSPRTAIINNTMARLLWPGGDAVGKRFKIGPADANGSWLTVVGVIGDMRRQGLEREPIPQMFEPLRQSPSRLATLLVRTASDDPLAMAGAVRSAVRRVSPRAPFYAVTTLESRLDAYLSERRFQAWLLAGFAAVALAIAAIGMYGLIRYSVSARTHEIGIRIAVGAQAGDVFRMVVRDGLRLSLTGLALGLAGSLWIGRAASALLFGVGAADPPTLAAVSLLLVLVAAAGCYFPARRAMRVDPAVALRQD